jgi:glycosyltransferase involved in cell wall biosynthesis
MSATVAFDVTHMSGTRTGVGRSIAEMHAALVRLGVDLAPYAWGGGLRAEDFPPGTRLLRRKARALIALWGYGIGKIDRKVRPASVVHATAFVPPATRSPTLVTVYDTTFLGEDADPVQRSWRRPLERALDRGAHVHVGTRSVATEVGEAFRLERKRIHLIGFGIPTLPDAEALPDDIARRIAGAPYIIAIGTLLRRKNIPRLVRAFERLDPSLRLVLVGADGPDRPVVDEAAAALGERVVVTGFVADGVRRTLIEGARALAYPSLYEGFGFPILEAMSLSVPVVTSGVGSMYDVAGGAAEFVEPTDVDSIASGLKRATLEGEHRDGLIARGRARAAEFTWERTAVGLRNVYDRLASTSS